VFYELLDEEQERRAIEASRHPRAQELVQLG
jgi:hypothetical protein